MTATTKLVSARFLPYSLHLSCRLVFPRTFIDNLVDVSEVLSFSPSCTWYPPSGCAYHTFLHISYVGTRTVFLHVFVFLDDRHFYSPPVRGFGLSDLLDKPWSQVGVFPFPPVLDFIFNRAKGSAFPPFSFFPCCSSICIKFGQLALLPCLPPVDLYERVPCPLR